MKSKSIGDKVKEIIGRGERKAIERQLDDLAAAKRDNEDGFLRLKDEIANLEERLLSQKKEFDRAHGERKLIVQQELTLTATELTGKRTRRDVHTNNLLRISKQSEALRGQIATQQDGLDEDSIDRLAVDRNEANDRQRRLDQATDDLAKEVYTSPAIKEPAVADVRDSDAELSAEVLQALEACVPRTSPTLTNEEK